jgi:hypothetical protein
MLENLGESGRELTVSIMGDPSTANTFIRLCLKVVGLPGKAASGLSARGVCERCVDAIAQATGIPALTAILFVYGLQATKPSGHHHLRGTFSQHHFGAKPPHPDAPRHTPQGDFGAKDSDISRVIVLRGLYRPKR